MESQALLRFLVALTLFCASAGALAIEPVTSLHCARKAAGLERAELRAHRTGPHEVLIKFYKVRPSARQLDWALRECLETASKLDSSRDIFASALFLDEIWAGGWKEIVEPLAPHGPAGSRAVYRASSGRVTLVQDGSEQLHLKSISGVRFPESATRAARPAARSPSPGL